MKIEKCKNRNEENSRDHIKNFHSKKGMKIG